MPASRLYCPEEEFTFRLRQRLPMNVGFTFTSEQLEALRQAFGERFDSPHAVDVRGKVHLPWSRYYLVVQAGRDRRSDTRRDAVSRTTRTAIDSFLCGVAIIGIATGITWLAMRFLF